MLFNGICTRSSTQKAELGDDYESSKHRQIPIFFCALVFFLLNGKQYTMVFKIKKSFPQNILYPGEGKTSIIILKYVVSVVFNLFMYISLF